MKLKDYWETLNDLLAQYDKRYGDIESADADDNKHYVHSRQRMEAMIKLGLQIEQTTVFDPKKKISLAKELDTLSNSKVPPEQIPAIPGPKSHAFTKEVVLPAIRSSVGVEHGKIHKWASKKIGMNIEEKTKKSLVIATVMEARIKDYEQNQQQKQTESIFLKQSIFYTDEKTTEEKNNAKTGNISVVKQLKK